MNIDLDLNQPGEVSAGPPGLSYGAAANQPGAWTAIPFGVGPIALLGLNGQASGVTLSRSNNPSSVTYDNGSSGDYAKLVGDGDQINSSTVYTLNGLDAGTYTIFVYAAAPFFGSTSTRISVTGAGSSQTVFNAPFDFTFVEGQTHSRHVLQHTGGPIVITAEKAGQSGVVNGIQIIGTPPPPGTVVQIESPAACSAVRGTVSVQGTASSPNLLAWILQYTGGASSTWTTIGTSGTGVVNGPLATWNTSTLDGQCGYTLRLVLYTTTGQTFETLRSVSTVLTGDANYDGSVNFDDITTVLSNFGAMP